MLKEFIWNMFEKTGFIDTYVFYKEIEERNTVQNMRNDTEDEIAISK